MKRKLHSFSVCCGNTEGRSRWRERLEELNDNARIVSAFLGFVDEPTNRDCGDCVNSLEALNACMFPLLDEYPTNPLKLCVAAYCTI